MTSQFKDISSVSVLPSHKAVEILSILTFIAVTLPGMKTIRSLECNSILTSQVTIVEKSLTGKPCGFWLIGEKVNLVILFQ